MTTQGLPSETSETGPNLPKVEEKIFSLIVAHGYRSREEIAEKCNQTGIDISVRSVSRYLKVLIEKGLLEREGNGYILTERALKQPRQDTL
jgi:predicted transcriptional regulator